MRIDAQRSSGTRHRRTCPADMIAVVEAAYRLEGTEKEWLDGIADAAWPLLGDAIGVAACAVGVESGEFRLRAISTRGGPPGFGEAVALAHSACDIEIRRRIFRSAPCTSLSASGGAGRVQGDPASQPLLRLGVRDTMAVVGVDSDRYGVLVNAFTSAPARLSRRTLSRWSRVATHLAAGFRIRRGLLASGSGPRADALSESDAIFTPTGRLEHATDAALRARDALARAVMDVSAARGPLRADDPDAALEVWTGLIAGTWSMIHHVDTDGRRFWVARKNPPDNAEPHGLSPRERQIVAGRARGLSLKLLAYDLGLSISSVSKSLKSGMQKLGLSCEAELATLVPA